MNTKVNNLSKQGIFEAVSNKEIDYVQFTEHLDILMSKWHAELILEVTALEARLRNATNLNNSILDEISKKGMVYRQPNASYSGDGLRLLWNQKNKAGVNNFVTMHIKPSSALMGNIDHVLNSTSGETSLYINDITITSRQLP